MADNVFDSISQVNTEAVPRALEAAMKLDENIAEIGSRTQSFKRDSEILIDKYQRDLTEQLMTADMAIDNTERKLQVLMKRLSKDVDHRSGQVEESTSHRIKESNSFIDETNNIDNETSAFSSVIEGFGGEIDQMSDTINTAIDSYETTANEMNDEINQSFEAYQQMFNEGKDVVASTLSAGTDTIMSKMGDLESLVNGTLDNYGDVSEGVVDFLRGQTAEGSDAFDSVLAIGEETLGGVAEVFDGSVGDIADKLEDIANLIETIKPILDFIDDLI